MSNELIDLQQKLLLEREITAEKCRQVEFEIKLTEVELIRLKISRLQSEAVPTYPLSVIGTS